MKEKNITLMKYNHRYPNTQQQNLNRSFADKPNKANQDDQSVVYSLKPLKYTIPKDVPVVEIFRLIRKSRYEEDKPITPLQLSSQDISNRREYIEKMKLFIVCEKFSYSIVSYSIYYMDLLISKNTQLPLEHIFIGSMILAIKYYSVETRVFLLKRLQKFMKDTSQKRYEIDDLLEIEIKCLMHLHYKLNWIHTNHFIQMLLLNGVVFNIDVSQNDKAEGSNIYDIIYDIMDSYYETGNYFPFDTFHLSCAIVTLARSICGFTPWSAFLAKVFSIDKHQFDICLSSVQETYYNQKRQTSPPRKAKEIKPLTTAKKTQEEDHDFNPIHKSRQVELIKSADKGIKTKSINFKMYYQDQSKEKTEGNIQSQRTMNNHHKKRLSIIKENDINSTVDNSFVSIADNLNKTMILKENMAKEKEENHLMMFQRSSKNIIKRDYKYLQEEIKPKSISKCKIDNDDKEKESSNTPDQIEPKKEMRKKGTISFSRQFNYQRTNTTQDKTYHGDFKRFNRKDQLNDTEDYQMTETNKFHRGMNQKKK